MTETEQILARCKRIETRVTIIGRHLGADVGGGQPEWRDGYISVPTYNCSLGEMTKVVPHDWPPAAAIHVYVQADYLFSFSVNRPRVAQG